MNVTPAFSSASRRSLRLLSRASLPPSNERIVTALRPVSFERRSWVQLRASHACSQPPEVQSRCAGRALVDFAGVRTSLELAGRLRECQNAQAHHHDCRIFAILPCGPRSGRDSTQRAGWRERRDFNNCSATAYYPEGTGCLSSDVDGMLNQRDGTLPRGAAVGRSRALPPPSGDE